MDSILPGDFTNWVYHGKLRMEIQRELAARLGMNVRTIIDIEKFRSNPKFETVVILANELDIDLGDIAEVKKDEDGISTEVRQFFSGMSDEEAERYIAMCVYIDSLYAPQQNCGKVNNRAVLFA